jgi:hypothetical protein
MRGARIAGIVLVAAIVGFVAAQWLWPRSQPAPVSPPVAQPAATQPSGPPAPLVSPDDVRIEPGNEVAIDSKTLEAGKPVVLHLVLAEASRTEEPRPVRVLSPEGQAVEGKGTLDDGRLEVRFEFDSAFLRPGRYIVEVKTTEMSHLPLRRYAINVR